MPADRRKEIDRLVRELKDLPLTDDERVTDEARNRFFELLRIPPPSDEAETAPPTSEDLAQLRLWLEDRGLLSDAERARLLANYHRSAAWRDAVDALRRERILRRRQGLQ